MKRFALAILLLFILTICSLSQQKSETTSKEFIGKWDVMTEALASEEWKNAYKLAVELSKEIPKDDKEKWEEKLRYMYLYAAAGSVLEKSMNYDQLEKLVKTEVGKQIIFPFRSVVSDCSRPAFNFICADGKDPKSLLVTASNATATTILAFEYLKFSDNPNLKKYIGKYVSFAGKVTELAPNPNRSNLIILRIYAENVKIFAVRDARAEPVTLLK